MSQTTARRLVERALKWDLSRNFKRIALCGSLPDVSPTEPLVVYCNHHNYYDGHLGWLFTHKVLERKGNLWMRFWDDYPFFAPAGALPFPEDDAWRRGLTIRKTMRRIRKANPPVFVYFPGGSLHPAEKGILKWDFSAIERVAHFLEPARWMPLAIHVTWRYDPLPVALLQCGEALPFDAADAHERLEAVWNEVQRNSSDGDHVLLEGRTTAHEQVNLSRFAHFFERYT